MQLSERNAKALLFDINQDIEEFAEANVKSIFEEKDFDTLTYPPNCGLTDLEKAELLKLDNNEHLKNALRKILANNAAGVIFNMLNLIDGATSPKRYYADWTGVRLVNEEESYEAEPLNEMLHDGFYEIYWEWRKVRGNKGWTLDTYDG